MYFGNNKVEIEDVPEPTVIDGDVKVKVSRNGICGTDLHEYYDGPISISPTAPHPLHRQGHACHPRPRVLRDHHRDRQRRDHPA